MTETQTIAFTKMNGLGNDFVIIDARKTPCALTAAQVQDLANRKNPDTKGCDQVLVIHTPRNGGDVFMQIFNADGHEVEACGNGARAVAEILHGQGGDTSYIIETDSGNLRSFTEIWEMSQNTNHADRPQRYGENPKQTKTKKKVWAPGIEMPPPQFGWADIPLVQEITDTSQVTLHPDLPPAFLVSVGNPHAVIFVTENPIPYAEKYGRALEHHELFSMRANINFAQIINEEKGIVRLATWERGVGLTKACGTGACATAIAVVEQDKSLATNITIRPHHILGNNVSDVIRVQYTSCHESIKMSGPVEHEFAGEDKPYAPGKVYDYHGQLSAFEHNGGLYTLIIIERKTPKRIEDTKYTLQLLTANFPENTARTTRMPVESAQKCLFMAIGCPANIDAGQFDWEVRASRGTPAWTEWQSLSFDNPPRYDSPYDFDADSSLKWSSFVITQETLEIGLFQFRISPKSQDIEPPKWEQIDLLLLGSLRDPSRSEIDFII